MSKYYLCITPFFPSPDSWRGAYVFDQVKAIQQNSEYEVIVFVTQGVTTKHSTYVIDGMTVHRLPSWFMPSYFFNGLGHCINGYILLNILDNLKIDLRDIAVAHAHTASLACYLSALKSKNRQIKTVIQYHDLDPVQIRLGKFAKWRPNIVFRVKNFTNQFKNIDLHLCISEKTLYNLKHFPFPHPQEAFKPYIESLEAARGLEIPRNIKSYVLYNGVDVTKLRAIDGLKDGDCFKIGCVSNFQDLKDHITLIKAVEEIVLNHSVGKKIKVSFIGSGPTKEYCKQYINSYNLDSYFIFEEEMRHEKLPSYFNSLDLFVLPSYFEGFGCVYTEAAACGVPFVGCLNQGYSEYISDEDKHLWLIEPHDYIKLADIIKRQIDSPIDQHLIHKFDINILMRQYIEFLSTI